MEKLPAPLRMTALVLWGLTMVHGKKNSDHGSIVVIPPTLVLLMGQMHALAFHLPAMWSTRVHAASCMRLTEHILYYGVLQSVVMELGMLCLSAWWPFASGSSCKVLVACYCGWYYAWSVSRLTLTVQKTGTLAPHMLILSMLLYATVTIPYYLYHQPPYEQQETMRNSTHHLVAWSIADACHYIMISLVIFGFKS